VVRGHPGRKPHFQKTLGIPHSQSKTDVSQIQWHQEFIAGDQCLELETNLYRHVPKSGIMGKRVGVERIERVGGRIQEATIPSAQEMCKCNTRIETRIGQPDCRGRITKDGVGRGTSQGNDKDHE